MEGWPASRPAMNVNATEQLAQAPSRREERSKCEIIQRDSFVCWLVAQLRLGCEHSILR
jgi:hypothetical protein